MLHLLAAPLLLIAQLAILPGIPAAGKDNAQPKGGTVAIVDLDAVSVAVGWNAEISDDRKATESEVNREFAAYAKTVQDAWATRRKAIGQAAHLDARRLAVIRTEQADSVDVMNLPLTRDQRDELIRCANEASETLATTKEYGNDVIKKREARVIEIYRNAAKPSVGRVAKAMGISVVALPFNTVFYYDPSADITAQVIDDLRKTMPPHDLPPMPKLNFGEFRFCVAPAAVPAPK